jgi:hypothetical protein
MSTTLTENIRPTGVPTFCSACHNQNPTLQHVDFDAACDRGYGTQDDNPDIKINMDDLILCETCLRDAARHIGMVDNNTQREYIARLERSLDETQKLRDQAVKYANRMEEALANRPEPVHATRPRGRPKKNGVDNDG